VGERALTFGHFRPDLLQDRLWRHVWDGRQVTDSVLRGCIHAIRVA